MKRMFTWILVLTALLCLPLFAAAESPVSDFKWEANDDGGVTITDYVGNGGDVVVPKQIDGKPVTRISDEAFFWRRNLIRVTIPDSVTSIGDYAFLSCESLTSVTIQNPHIQLGSNVFSASPLQELVLPEGGRYVCTASGFLADTAGEGGVTILDYFGQDFVLEIPAQINGLPVTAIGKEAFYDSSSLTSVILPDSVMFIDDYAFRDCYYLTSITIQNPDIQLGRGVFPKALSLQGQGLVFPEGGRYACTASGFLADLSGEHGVTIIDYIGSDDHELVIPSQINGRPVTAIGSYAFSHSDAESIIIPDGVTSICTYAFHTCNMASITIPDSVTSIADAAFFDCIFLHTINASEKVYQMAENAIASDL